MGLSVNLIFGMSNLKGKIFASLRQSQRPKSIGPSTSTRLILKPPGAGNEQEIRDIMFLVPAWYHG